MIRLIRTELLKLTTMRLTYGLLAIAAALTALFSLLENSRAGASGTGVPPISTADGLRTVTTVTGFAMLLSAVLGSIVANGEFRHSTATQTYLATPRRVRVLAAKAAAAVGVGSLFGLVAGVISTSIGLIFVAAHGDHVALSTGTLVGTPRRRSHRRCTARRARGRRRLPGPFAARHRDRDLRVGHHHRVGHRRPLHLYSSLPALHRGHHSRGGETRRGRVRSRPRAQRRCPPTVRRRRSPPGRHRRSHCAGRVSHHAATRHHLK